MESVRCLYTKTCLSLNTLELDYNKDKSEYYMKRSSKSNSSMSNSFGECKGVVVLYISSSAP